MYMYHYFDMVVIYCVQHKQLGLETMPLQSMPNKVCHKTNTALDTVQFVHLVLALRPPGCSHILKLRLHQDFHHGWCHY